MLVFVTVALWIVFAPVKLGGRATYILVSGNSMEPNFHRGDLVITQKSQNYQVGEAIAYYHPLLDGVIYHRIVAQSNETYIVQGDANSWLDSHEPSVDEVLGKEWLYLPGFGRILEKARQPAWLVTIVVAFVLMSVWPYGDSDRLMDPDDDNEYGKETWRGKFYMGEKSKVQELFYLSLAIAFLGLVGLIFFMTKPSTEIIENFSAVQHSVTFGYSSPAPEDVYASGFAQTGDPIFRRVSSSMAVSFDYELEGLSSDEISGEYRLALEISDESGWRREVELVPMTDFTTGSFQVEHNIWFYNIQTVIENFRNATGIDRTTYQISIVPEISVIASGNPLRVSTFTPNLDFSYTPVEVKLNRPMDEVIYQTEEFILATEGKEDAAITLFNRQIPVIAARYLAGLVMIIALGAAGGLYWHDSKMTGKGGREAANYVYGDLIVEIEHMSIRDTLIEVESFEGMVALAEQNRVNILLYEEDESDNYYINLPGETYHFKAERAIGLKDIPEENKGRNED
jgi:signal peptidase I